MPKDSLTPVDFERLAPGPGYRLVVTGGRQRSEAEFRDLYTRAGFELTRIVPTPARVAVIEGAPARG